MAERKRYEPAMLVGSLVDLQRRVEALEQKLGGAPGASAQGANGAGAEGSANPQTAPAAACPSPSPSPVELGEGAARGVDDEAERVAWELWTEGGGEASAFDCPINYWLEFAIPTIARALAQARRDEREACAKLCERQPIRPECVKFAAVIRARGESAS